MQAMLGEKRMTVRNRKNKLPEGAIVEHLHRVSKRGGKYTHKVYRCKVYYFDSIPFLRAFGRGAAGKIWFQPVQTETGLYDYKAITRPDLVEKLEIKARRAYHNQYNLLKRLQNIS